MSTPPTQQTRSPATAAQAGGDAKGTVPTVDSSEPRPGLGARISSYLSGLFGTSNPHRVRNRLKGRVEAQTFFSRIEDGFELDELPLDDQELLERFGMDFIIPLLWYQHQVGWLMHRRRATKWTIVVVLLGAVVLLLIGLLGPGASNLLIDWGLVEGTARVGVELGAALSFDALMALIVATATTVFMVLRFFASMSDDAPHLPHFWRAKASLASARYALENEWRQHVLRGGRLDRGLVKQLVQDMKLARAVMAVEQETFFVNLASPTELFDGAVKLLRGVDATASHANERLKRLQEELDAALSVDRVRWAGTTRGRSVHFVVALPGEAVRAQVPDEADRQAIAQGELYFADGSAERIRDLCSEQYYAPRELITGAEATVARLDAVFREWRAVHERDPEDLLELVLSFNGHGVWSEDRSRALLCLFDGLVDGDWFAERLAAFGARVSIVLVLDCCHAGELLKEPMLVERFPAGAQTGKFNEAPTVFVVGPSQTGLTPYAQRANEALSGSLLSRALTKVMNVDSPPDLYQDLADALDAEPGLDKLALGKWPRSAPDKAPFRA